MSNEDQLINDAIDAAKLAIKFDEEGQASPSAYYYKIAAKWLDQAAQSVSDERSESLKKKSNEYEDRAEALLAGTNQEVKEYVLKPNMIANNCMIAVYLNCF